MELPQPGGVNNINNINIEPAVQQVIILSYHDDSDQYLASSYHMWNWAPAIDWVTQSAVSCCDDDKLSYFLKTNFYQDVLIGEIVLSHDHDGK